MAKNARSGQVRLGAVAPLTVVMIIQLLKVSQHTLCSS